MKSLEEFGRQLAEAEMRFPKRFLWAILIITIIMIPGILQMKIEPSLEKVLPQDLEVLKKMNFMRDQFGADMVYVFYSTDNTKYIDIRQPEILKQIEASNEKILTEKNVLTINSITAMVREYNNNVMPEDYDRVKEIFDEAKTNGDPRLSLVNYDYSTLIVEIKTNTGANAGAIKELVDTIRYDVKTSNQLGLTTGLTGYNALDKATFEVIISDFSYTTLIAFLFVAIVVYFTFKSLVKGMIPMVIVLISLLWTNGTVGYLGIAMTVASMGAAAMVMGLGIDFGIHLISLYQEFREKGKI